MQIGPSLRSLKYPISYGTRSLGHKRAKMAATSMTRDGLRYREVDSGFWQPAFARITTFSVLLLAAILSIRVFTGLSSHDWARYSMVGPILHDVEASAIILLCLTGILPGCWHATRRDDSLLETYRQLDYGRTLQLAGITLGALAAILSARAFAVQVLDRSWCLTILDFAGGLLVPLGAVIALAIFPDVFLKAVWTTLPVVAIVCIFCLGTLNCNRSRSLPSSPAIKTQPVQYRPAAHLPMFC